MAGNFINSKHEAAVKDWFEDASDDVILKAYLDYKDETYTFEDQLATEISENISDCVEKLLDGASSREIGEWVEGQYMEIRDKWIADWDHRNFDFMLTEDFEGSDDDNE